MTQSRPTLATAICIYEGLAGLYILGGYALSQFLFYTVEPGAHRLMLSTTHTALTLLASLLSFAIAFALWNVRREAFFLVLLKLLLTLFTTASVFYVLITGRSHVSASAFDNPMGVLFFWIPRILGVGFLLITIAIAIYVYRFTIATASPSLPSNRTHP